MEITVAPATAADEPVLRNLAQFYAYDFAELMALDIPDSGRFADAIVDGCFDGKHRHPFLVRVEGRLAGFAIVDTRSYFTGDEGIRDVAEFFVARRYRGRGVGDQVARALFDRFGGRWEVRQTEPNAGALAFWRKVIGRYTNGRFDESIRNEARWRGPVQSFVCPEATGRSRSS